MEKTKWLHIVESNKETLHYLVANYHPSARVSNRQKLHITAPNVEQACENVREQIRQTEKEDPVERFDKAVEASDVSSIITLLDDAWFGVPESTDCWSIEGFDTAVELLDDLPREEVENAKDQLPARGDTH